MYLNFNLELTILVRPILIDYPYRPAFVYKRTAHVVAVRFILVVILILTIIIVVVIELQAQVDVAQLFIMLALIQLAFLLLAQL